MTDIECTERSIEDERKEKRRAATRRWRAKNKEKIRDYRQAYDAATRERTADSRRAYQLQYKYGITSAEWDKMFAAQGSRCATCGSDQPKSDRGWQTDHCHATGVVRGILCRPCNKALGLLKDNTSTLSNAISYLNRFRQ